MNIRLLLFPACLLAVLLPGHAADTASTPPSAPNSPALPPEAVDPSYRLGPGDLVSVHVYGEDLDVTQQLDAAGKLRLPLLDEVKLAGQTLREAERSLQWLFREREFLKTPMVTVTLTSVALREASVLGAVRTPGDFPFPNQTRSLSIVDLITRTGGFLPVAKADAVKVTRHNADGTDTTTTVDVESMLSGHHHGKDFQVLPGDHIWVPERLF